MNQYFEKFLDWGRGTRVQRIFTLEWALAVQGALRALAQGENISAEGGVMLNRGTDRVRIGRRGERKSYSGGTRETVIETPLTITKTRPPYIVEPSASEYEYLYLTWGFVNGLRPNNWSVPIEIPLVGDFETFIVIKIFTGGSNDYSFCQWEKFTNRAEFQNPQWNANGGRPAHFYVFLGSIQRYDGEVYIFNEGVGSIHVYEYLAGIDSTGSDVASVYRYGVAYRRI